MQGEDAGAGQAVRCAATIERLSIDSAESAALIRGCAGPHGAIPIDGDGNYTTAGLKIFELVTLPVRQALKSADPKTAIGRRRECRDVFAGELLAIRCLPPHKVQTIESQKSVIGTDPQLARGGLCQSQNRSG
jgi:hypothetical protein